MDDYMASEEEIRIYNEIQKKQAVLDKGWSKPRKRRWFIGATEVTEEKYLEHQREQTERVKSLHSEDRFTSTGEEWETDSDGDYTPDWLY